MATSDVQSALVFAGAPGATDGAPEQQGQAPHGQIQPDIMGLQAEYEGGWESSTQPPIIKSITPSYPTPQALQQVRNAAEEQARERQMQAAAMANGRTPGPPPPQAGGGVNGGSPPAPYALTVPLAPGAGSRSLAGPGEGVHMGHAKTPPSHTRQASAEGIPEYPEYDMGEELRELTKKLASTQTKRYDVTFHKLRMDVMLPGGGPCWDRKPSTKKTILHGIDGVFAAGKFTAIMGASGAGKTTLLNAVAGEAAGGNLSGYILVNGASVGSDVMRKISVFVFQDDVVLATMTVREVIFMSARLRLPTAMSIEEKMSRVENVIKILHLQRCADTVIGNPGDRGGISGGERKRTAIAMELITDPSILFLDEPTSGLDTFTAFSVVQTLKSLAAAGRTVVATIHQPSSDIFHMFDNLMLLAHGKILYQGPSPEAVNYFAARGYPCPDYTNPADHIFMKILNDTDAMDDQEKMRAGERVQSLLRDYSGSIKAAELSAKSIATGQGVDISAMPPTCSWGDQFSTLFQRAARNAVRNRLIVRAKFGQSIFMGLLAGLIWRDLGRNQVSVQDRNGCLFFVAVNSTMAATQMMLSSFGPERQVFERERSHGMYRTLPYFMSKIIMELPPNCIFPCVQGTIAYFLLHLQRDASKFGHYIATVVLLQNTGNALGIMIASMFSDLEVIIAVSPLIILPLMIFSGFFVADGGIPVYFDWIKYISPMKYSFASLALNEYTGLELFCEADELVARPNCPQERDPAGNPVWVVEGSVPKLTECVCPYTTGEQVTDYFGMTGSDGITLPQNLTILFCMWMCFLVIAFLLLYRLVRNREVSRAKLLSSSGIDQARETAQSSFHSHPSFHHKGGAPTHSAVSRGGPMLNPSGPFPPPGGGSSHGSLHGSSLHGATPLGESFHGGVPMRGGVPVPPPGAWGGSPPPQVGGGGYPTAQPLAGYAPPRTTSGGYGPPPLRTTSGGFAGQPPFRVASGGYGQAQHNPQQAYQNPQQAYQRQLPPQYGAGAPAY